MPIHYQSLIREHELVTMPMAWLFQCDSVSEHPINRASAQSYTTAIHTFTNKTISVIAYRPPKIGNINNVPLRLCYCQTLEINWLLKLTTILHFYGCLTSSKKTMFCCIVTQSTFYDIIKQPNRASAERGERSGSQGEGSLFLLRSGPFPMTYFLLILLSVIRYTLS